MKREEGEIKKIEEVFDDIDCRIKYQIVIWFEELPNIKLGKCKVNQDEIQMPHL